MCGRFVATAPPNELADYFQAVLSESVIQADLEPSYNVAPTNMIHTVRDHDGHRELEAMKWGLVPSWAKDSKIGSRMINARADTAATKPAFRSAIKKRRCLVPADGFYEWHKVEGQKNKQPYYITRKDEEPVVFAGMWEAWKPKPETEAYEKAMTGVGSAEELPWLITCTLLTTDPNEEMKRIHHRMPVLVPPAAWDRWLDSNNGVEEIAELLVPAPDGLLKVTPITTRVNNVRNKGPQLIEEAPQ
ncbi:MAG: SOS response-associated peptidase [Acidimicrobiia bacterium]|nr:SOS response-associated peptidase [Acidimicrobiia bacterium]